MKQPFLQVIAAPEECGVAVGQRLELPCELGRGIDTTVSVSLPTVARRHCRFSVEHGRVMLLDFNTTNGTFVNGVLKTGSCALTAGDCVELPFGVALQVVDASASRAISLEGQERFLSLVTQSPHDAGTWGIWADQLLEAGDPLGPRIARGRGADAADDARVLGPLARAYVEGSLEVDWWHGFIGRAVLRNVDQWPPLSWLREWKLLLHHPLAHLAEALEIDALSYSRGLDGGEREGVEAKILTSLELLTAAPVMPLLKSVRFGPSPRPLWNQKLEAAWRGATLRHPALRTGPIWVARAAWLQLLSTPHGVSVSGLEVGAQRKLDEEGANLIGPLPDCTFALDAPDGSAASAVAMRLDREGGLWLAEDMGHHGRRLELPLYVNGRRCTRHRMRPGDVLEPAPGLTFRFVME